MKDIFEANFETEEIANFVQNSGEYYLSYGIGGLSYLQDFGFYIEKCMQLV